MIHHTRRTNWCKAPTRTDCLVGAFVVACILAGSHLIWGAVAQRSTKPDFPQHALTQAVATGESELANNALPSAQLFTKPIQDIQVGERVLAENPTGEQDLSLGEDVDPASWRRIELRAPKNDGSWAEVVLLRPQWWLEEQAALNGTERIAVGDTVEISVPECGIDGDAEVRAIGPCPQIRRGPGRVVTGTFKHPSAAVVNVYVEGLKKPIGATANHPFWSEDRQQFVVAEKLRAGECLASVSGDLRQVISSSPNTESHPVYNLEIHGEHVYFVTDTGLLVHNGTPCPKWANAPGTGGLKGHARKHGGGMTPRQYHAQALKNIRDGQPYRFYHDGQFKIGYITDLGNGKYLLTSVSENGKTIFTHMEVTLEYLKNIGITLRT